jgi:molecular chaperone DnaK (HSP70)
VPQQSEGVAITVPFFWTREMRQSIANAVHLSRIRLLSILDDSTAIAAIYGGSKFGRYQRLSGRNWSVVFVDVGATSAKIYGCEFEWRVNASYAQLYGMNWNDHVGSHWFAKRVSAAMGIPMSDAEEILRERPDSVAHLMTQELSELVDLINQTVREGNSTDEVQLIGGASNIPFVREAVKNATASAPLKTDFIPHMPIALGTIYSLMMAKQLGTNPDVFLTRKSINDVKLLCSKPQEYCRRGEGCRTEVIERGGACEYAVMLAPGGVPEGVSYVVSAFHIPAFANYTLKDGEFIKFKTSIEETFIKAAELCNQTGCKDVEVQPLSMDAQVISDKNKWVSAIMAEKSRKVVKRKLLERLAKVIREVDKVLEDEGMALQATSQEAAEEIANFLETRRKYNEHELDQLENVALNSTVADVVTFAGRLGIPDE